MNKIEEIKKELEKNLGYNFNNWGKGDLKMLKEIVVANDKVVKKLALSDVGKRSELLLFDEYIYSNECQHDRDRGGVVDRYLAKK